MTNHTADAQSDLRRVELHFDDRVDFGSPEHFFHFMWGYLLPAAHEILERLGAGAGQEKYVFTSCGPKMDPLIAEVAHCLGIRFAIENPNSACDNLHVLTVPRWDVFMLRPHLLTHLRDENIRITRIRDAFRCYLPEVWRRFYDPITGIRDAFRCHLPKVWRRFSDPGFVADLRCQVTRVRDVLLRCAEQSPCASSYDGFIGRYLIVRREKEHPFYTKGGGAKILKYGASRRELSGIDDAARVLEKHGFAVSVFVAGAHSLIGQALAFHRCRGIAMIRGAEIANLIWVRPGTPLLILAPIQFGSIPSVHDQLAELFSLKLTHVITQEGNSVLDPDLARQAWSA